MPGHSSSENERKQKKQQERAKQLAEMAKREKERRSKAARRPVEAPEEGLESLWEADSLTPEQRKHLYELSKEAGQEFTPEEIAELLELEKQGKVAQQKPERQFKKAARLRVEAPPEIESEEDFEPLWEAESLTREQRSYIQALSAVSERALTPEEIAKHLGLESQSNDTPPPKPAPYNPPELPEQSAAFLAALNRVLKEAEESTLSVSIEPPTTPDIQIENPGLFSGLRNIVSSARSFFSNLFSFRKKKTVTFSTTMPEPSKPSSFEESFSSVSLEEGGPTFNASLSDMPPRSFNDEISFTPSVEEDPALSASSSKLPSEESTPKVSSEELAQRIAQHPGGHRSKAIVAEDPHIPKLRGESDVSIHTPDSIGKSHEELLNEHKKRILSIIDEVGKKLLKITDLPETPSGTIAPQEYWQNIVKEAKDAIESAHFNQNANPFKQVNDAYNKLVRLNPYTSSMQLYNQRLKGISIHNELGLPKTAKKIGVALYSNDNALDRVTLEALTSSEKSHLKENRYPSLLFYKKHLGHTRNNRFEGGIVRHGESLYFNYLVVSHFPKIVIKTNPKEPKKLDVYRQFSEGAKWHQERLSDFSVYEDQLPVKLYEMIHESVLEKCQNSKHRYRASMLEAALWLADNGISLSDEQVLTLRTKIAPLIKGVSQPIFQVTKDTGNHLFDVKAKTFIKHTAEVTINGKPTPIEADQMDITSYAFSDEVLKEKGIAGILKESYKKESGEDAPEMQALKIMESGTIKNQEEGGMANNLVLSLLRENPPLGNLLFDFVLEKRAALQAEKPETEQQAPSNPTEDAPAVTQEEHKVKKPVPIPRRRPQSTSPPGFTPGADKKVSFGENPISSKATYVIDSEANRMDIEGKVPKHDTRKSILKKGPRKKP